MNKIFLQRRLASGFASLQMTSICNFALKTEPAAILESIGEHYQHLFFIIIKKNHSVEENIWLT